jgi:hypothetical protein
MNSLGRPSPLEYTYLSDGEGLMGYRDGVLLLYGAWYERNDLELILNLARIRNMNILVIDDYRP